MESGIQIHKLDPADKKSILKIADWYSDEWNTPIDKTIDRLTNQPSKDTIFQLVLTLEKEVIATGGLCNNVNIFKIHEQFKENKPWVALLYTQKDYRKKGFGAMLLNQIEHGAKETNLNKIYLYTYTAEAFYRRCGWKVIDKVMYKGRDTSVMEKSL